MTEQVDPKLYGLPPRTVLMKMDSGKFQMPRLLWRQVPLFAANQLNFWKRKA
jgi:hypothetical protein